MPVLKSIYRYPIKGLSAQPLTRVDIEAKKPFPLDPHLCSGAPAGRRTTSGSRDGARKAYLVMLMLEEALARVRTTLDVETMQLTIAQDNRQLLVADLNDEGERARVEQFIWQLLPTFRSPPTSGALGRRTFHGQAGQRHLADQSGNGSKS